jgi:hypothetical protein
MITLGAKQSEAARDAGVAQAAASRAKVLGFARGVARELATTYGQTDADAVATALELQGIDTTAELGNAAGAIFRGKGWTFVGYKKSVRVSRHANKIGIWAFNPELA